MGLFKSVLGKYHSAVNHLFSQYGAFVARRPFLPLGIGTILLGALCIGLLHAEKETDLEKLWVEQNSRVVPEKKFFDSHFGGLPRKEGLTINSKGSLDANFKDYRHAMDALAYSITPLYDNITLSVTHDQKSFELTQGDFCERPRVPIPLQNGTGPENYLAWGYRNISDCVLDTIASLGFSDFNSSSYKLPRDWGFNTFPCFKLTPMDCFREGQAFDFPEAFQQLGQIVNYNNTFVPLNLLVFAFETQPKNPDSCLGILNHTLTSSAAYSAEEIENILGSLKSLVPTLAAWGYNWRPSYKTMSNDEILDYFNSAINMAKNASTDPTDPAVHHCLTEQKPCCLSWFGLHIPLAAAFGSVKYDPSGQISGIGAFRWGANNFNQEHPLWVEYMRNRLEFNLTPAERKDLVVNWENVMIQKVANLRENEKGTEFAVGGKYEDLQVQFSMWRSSEDVLKDANKTPIWQLVLSAVLVSLYSYAAFVNFRNPVHSHTWLVLTGLTVVSFAVVAGFGLTSAVGIKLTPLAGSVVPFLALGLGIDDVFVLVTILRNSLKNGKTEAMDQTDSKIPEREMRWTVALAGPSVLLTTFSVLASFFISSLNPMPVVRWFCWQMGITATIHTCGMLLIFIPMMALDARRVKSRVNDPYLWLFFGVRSKKEVQEDTQSLDRDGLSFHENAATSPISIAVAKFYAPLFNSNLFKVLVVIFFAGLLGSMTYLGFWKVQHGLKLSEVTLKGSYQHDYAVVTEDRFPDYDIWMVTQDITDYAKAQQDLIDLYTSAQQNLSYWTPAQPKIFETSWLGNLYLAVNSSLNLSYPLQQNFYPVAQAWTTSPVGILSLPDMYCRNTSTGDQTSCFAEQALPYWSIGATKTPIFAENLGADTERNLDMIRGTRRFMDDYNEKHFNGSKGAYMYGYPFLFFEQYLHSSHDLYMVVGFALVGVFVAVLLFQFSLVVSLLIALVLLMVDIEVYGFLYVMDAKLNSLSLVNLGIVIGMASELTYLARSFLVIDGTRNHRVGKALEWTFEPLLHGFGTQVAATLPLLFLKYHGFRLYYFAMFTVMGILAFLNGFVLLPVFLSWFGPAPLPHARLQGETEMHAMENGSSSQKGTNGHHGVGEM